MTEEMLETYTEFLSRCLVVHRFLPYDDIIIRDMWAEYCHNLGYLLTGLRTQNNHSVQMYEKREQFFSRIMYTKKLPKRVLEKKYKLINEAIETVFHGSYENYINTMKEYIETEKKGRK